MIPEKLHSSADTFYTEEESIKYNRSNHYRKTQCGVLDYILDELLLKNSDNILKRSKTLLDIGIGCNIYSDVYNTYSHLNIIGLDISLPMLNLVPSPKPTLLLFDLNKKKLPFSNNSIDLIISISCIQWLFNNNEGEMESVKSLFESVICVLNEDGVAVFQFYFVDNSLNKSYSSGHNQGEKYNNQLTKLINILTNLKTKWKLVCDSKSKKRKVFLILWKNEKRFEEIVDCNVCYDFLSDSSEKVVKDSFKHKGLQSIGTTKWSKQGKNKKVKGGRKEFIKRKKDKSRSKGILVPRDSKYSGRKRRRN
ncbi:18S rRNA (guanine-N(7))-methyltransferase RID2 [Cucumispora dikerogammari]|nr:18S rRNA (guanine-N(7))-methyltransferase RID2 [Cucumispora dikerogammari]